MGFITDSVEEVKAMNNLGGGVPPEVPFVGPSVGVSEDVNLYANSTGSDVTGDGSQAAPWASLQRAFDAFPDGYTGAGVIFLGAGTFDKSAELRSLVDETVCSIAVVGDTSGGFDISGQTFAFVDNATASAVVDPFTDFNRGDRWLEPSTFPVPDLSGFGTPEFSGTTLEASSGGTTLVATMGATAVGDDAVGVRPYNTQLTASYVGTKQHGVNLQLIGLDFGSGEITREGCIFIGCKATASINQRNITGCGGFLTIVGGGSFFGAQVTNLAPNAWASISGSYENTLLVRNNVQQVVLTTAVAELDAIISAINGAANSSVGMNFLEVRSGRAMLVQGNSRGFATGNVNVVGAKYAEAMENSSIEFIGAGYTGTVTDGVEAQESSRIDGKSALSAVTASGTEVTAGVSTGTFAGADVVDAAAALSACT